MRTSTGGNDCCAMVLGEVPTPGMGLRGLKWASFVHDVCTKGENYVNDKSGKSDVFLSVQL